MCVHNDVHVYVSSLETTKTTLETVTQEKDHLSNTVRKLEVEIKRLKQELSDEQDKSAITGDVSSCNSIGHCTCELYI